MAIANPDRALDYLKRIVCYRPSGYWFPLRQRSYPAQPLNEHNEKSKKAREKRVFLSSFCAGPTLQNVMRLDQLNQGLKWLL